MGASRRSAHSVRRRGPAQSRATAGHRANARHDPRMGSPAEVDEVRYDVHGGVAVVTIDRQHRRNAIDGRTAAALVDALERFEADEALAVLVLTGAGEAFCAGADLTAIETLSPRADGPDGPLGFTRRTATKPTIAAVDGWAVAGGLELALWCDLRIASPRSTFGCFERRWGVPLIDGGTWRLPRVVGMGRALDMILTGRAVDATEALAIGLANRIEDDPLAAAIHLLGWKAWKEIFTAIVPAADDAIRPDVCLRGMGASTRRGTAHRDASWPRGRRGRSRGRSTIRRRRRPRRLRCAMNRECHQSAEAIHRSGGPPGARTRNPRIKSPLLCQLS